MNAFFAAMQALSMKLINYQKQAVRERGTEGQRLILVDKRRRLGRSNSLTAEYLTAGWPLTSWQSPDLSSVEQDGGQLISDRQQWPECLFISTVIYTRPEKLSRIIVWNWSHPLPSPSVMPGLLSTVHPFLSEYCIVHHCMQMGQFIFLSLRRSASVSLAWPFPSEGILLRPVALSSGTEVFNNCPRILFSWILITLIKGIDQWDPGVFTAPLSLSIIQLQYPPWLFRLYALFHCLTPANILNVTVYNTCKGYICFYILYTVFIEQETDSVSIKSCTHSCM